MNDSFKKALDVAKEMTLQISLSAINTAVCGFVARKVNYMIDEQEQRKISELEKEPPPEKKRIGFSNDK